jgi:hypothetical protein
MRLAFLARVLNTVEVGTGLGLLGVTPSAEHLQIACGLSAPSGR